MDPTTQTATTQTSQISPTDPRLAKFRVPQVVFEKYSDLIPLILDTQSMNDEEKSYWFQILPIMTDEQVQKLRNILITEKDQLAKLDKEYEEEMDTLNKKHLNQWSAYKAQEKREEIKKEETSLEAKESETEEELLSQLSSI